MVTSTSKNKQPFSTICEADLGNEGLEHSVRDRELMGIGRLTERHAAFEAGLRAFFGHKLESEDAPLREVLEYINSIPGGVHRFSEDEANILCSYLARDREEDIPAIIMFEGCRVYKAW